MLQGAGTRAGACVAVWGFSHAPQTLLAFVLWGVGGEAPIQWYSRLWWFEVGAYFSVAVQREQRPGASKAMSIGTDKVLQRLPAQRHFATTSEFILWALWACVSRPVGYVDFMDQRSAADAEQKYNRWQGWTARGLAIEWVDGAHSGRQGKRARDTYGKLVHGLGGDVVCPSGLYLGSLRRFFNS